MSRHVIWGDLNLPLVVAEVTPEILGRLGQGEIINLALGCWQEVAFDFDFDFDADCSSASQAWVATIFRSWRCPDLILLRQRQVQDILIRAQDPRQIDPYSLDRRIYTAFLEALRETRA